MLIPKKLAGISKIAAKEQTRYAINGVHVVGRTDGTCVVSVTDGRMMVQVTCDDEDVLSKRAEEFSTVIPVHTWDEGMRADGPRCKHVLLDEKDTKQVTLSSTQGKTTHTVSAEPCDGTFPDVAQVIPDYEAGDGASEIGVDLTLLAGLLALVGGIVDSERRNMRLIVPTDPKRPLTIKGDNGAGLKVVAVIMPRTFKTDA